MRKVLAKIKMLVRYYIYWVLDYVYVGYWQVLGFFRRTDIHAFLQSSWQTQRKQIILLPGIYERWEFMKPIAMVLLQAGYSVHAIEGLGYNRTTVQQAAEVVEKYVVDNDLKDCIIVAHSKGGLIGKYLLGLSNARPRFAGMVALNTPFSGSFYANLFPFASIKVFAPNSPTVKLLAKETKVNEKIYSIYSTFDPHIPETSYLRDAKNIQLPVYGHFRIIHDHRVHAELLKAVRSISKSPYTK